MADSGRGGGDKVALGDLDVFQHFATRVDGLATKVEGYTRREADRV